MFDIYIIHKFNVLICFNQGSNTINEPISIGEKCVDSGVPPHNGSPVQPQFTGMQPHDGATTKAHDGIWLYINHILNNFAIINFVLLFFYLYI